MEVNINEKKKVNIKKISISGKTSDLCFLTLYDKDGVMIKEHDGYVPRFMPNGGGDYIDLDIDIDTGQILNWKIDKKMVENFLNEEEEE